MDEEIKKCPVCNSEEVERVNVPEPTGIETYADCCLDCGHHWNIG